MYLHELYYKFYFCQILASLNKDLPWENFIRFSNFTHEPFHAGHESCRFGLYAWINDIILSNFVNIFYKWILKINGDYIKVIVSFKAPRLCS